MAKMASLHAAENEEPYVSRETINQRRNEMTDLEELVDTAKAVGALNEQLRIIALIKERCYGSLEPISDLLCKLIVEPESTREPCGHPCKCDNTVCENGY
jgi:hypothetical protein